MFAVFSQPSYLVTLLTVYTTINILVLYRLAILVSTSEAANSQGLLIWRLVLKQKTHINALVISGHLTNAVSGHQMYSQFQRKICLRAYISEMFKHLNGHRQVTGNWQIICIEDQLRNCTWGRDLIAFEHFGFLTQVWYVHLN